MNKRIFISLIVFASLICGGIINAQSSVAFVNTIELINSLPDKISASERLSTLNENYKQELQIMQKE